MSYTKQLAYDLMTCKTKIEFIHYIIDNNLLRITKNINYPYELEGCIYGVC